MFFNLFRKNERLEEPVESESTEVLARLSYVVTSDSDSPIVDVELKEYNDECIAALCDILDIIAEDRSLIETVDIIKNAMINDHQEENLYKIFSHLGQNAKTKMLNSYKNKGDEPCIKPSDMFAI